MRSEVISLDQHDLKTPSCGVTGNACAVNAAADDEQVKIFEPTSAVIVRRYESGERAPFSP